MAATLPLDQVLILLKSAPVGNDRNLPSVMMETASVISKREILDRYGHSYQLDFYDDGTLWRVNVSDSGAVAGYVNCLPQGEQLFLADLHVHASARHPIRGLSWLRAWIGIGAKGRKENYRNRGLGSVLLSVVVDHARSRGFKRVSGELKQVDLRENPSLPDWYRARGFQVTMEATQLAGEVVFIL